MSIDTSQSLDERDFDRSLIRWIMKNVGNPRISIRLWDGDEFPVTAARPVACMEFRQRRAVFELLRSPSLGFGECYSRGLIEIHGDVLAFMNEITAALTRKRGRSYYGPHRHYHEVYHFPVHTDHGRYFRPHVYCQGDLYGTRALTFRSPRVSFHFDF